MNTRMMKVKNSNDLPESLKGFISLQVVDGCVEAVTIKVGEEYVRICKADSYNSWLSVLKQEPKKTVTKYLLSGKFLGMVDVKEQFDTLSEAQDRNTEYRDKSGWDNEDTLSISEIEVEEDETKI